MTTVLDGDALRGGDKVHRKSGIWKLRQAVRRSESLWRESDSKLAKDDLVPSASRNSRDLDLKTQLYL